SRAVRHGAKSGVKLIAPKGLHVKPCVCTRVRRGAPSAPPRQPGAGLCAGAARLAAPTPLRVPNASRLAPRHNRSSRQRGMSPSPGGPRPMDTFKNVASLAPTKQAFSLLEEFKAFAFKGNVIDLAVGVIIGASFKSITDSLVKHLIMPLISVIMPGEQGYLEWKWVVNGKEIPYGLFLGEVVNFLIIAVVLFIVV